MASWTEQKTDEQKAAYILDKIGNSSSHGEGSDDIAGAIVGVGHALLAINSQLQGLRNEISATRTVLKAKN